MKRIRLALCIAVAVAAVTVPSLALALDECKGWPRCVPVVGPWVVIPTSASGGLASSSWHLRCPKGYVVGGTDARATDRRVEVSFRAFTGSPVSAGVSTRADALLTGRSAGAAPAAFQPAIGCVPTAGGGGRALTGTTRAAAVVRPGEPFVLRVATVKVVRQSATAEARCPAGRRLLEATHAVAFRGSAPPSQALIDAVRTTGARDGSTARARATIGAPIPSGVSALLQVQALCERGRG